MYVDHFVFPRLSLSEASLIRFILIFYCAFNSNLTEKSYAEPLNQFKLNLAQDILVLNGFKFH